MNKTIKLTLFLAIVAALATGILAAVNQMTYPIITANEAKAQNAELAVLYPDATNFTPVEFTDESGLVKEAYQVDDKAHVFKVESQGYSSVISFLVGYDNDGSNSKFKILSNNDTPGYGQRLMEDSYHQAMTGKKTSDAVEMVSNATATSTAVKDGVDAAVKVFNALTGSTATPSEPEKPEEPTAKVYETIEEGTSKVYLVESVGFNKGAVNKVRVKISDANLVEEVSFEEFGDSDFEGAPARDAAFLDLFKGLDVTADIDVDTKTGATRSSNAVLEAVKAAAAAHTGGDSGSTPQEPETVTIQDTLTEGTSTVYLVDSVGFNKGAVNKIRIKISEAGLIEEVSFDEFGDSDFEGAPARANEFLDQFKGLDVKSDITVDTKTGATHSSNSVLEAVKKVAQEFGGQ